MRRRLVAGFLGGLVLLAWFIIVDGMLGFVRSFDMNRLPDERTVYVFLKEHVTRPGRYVCNPEVSPGQGFPGEDPIFGVEYSGLGHADAGQEMIVGLAFMVLAPVVGALMLGRASPGVLSCYASRFAFFAAIGVILGLFSIQVRFGISRYPLGDAVALAAHDFAAWAVAGLAVAGLIRPQGRKRAATPH
jgi:hypothetical protein